MHCSANREESTDSLVFANSVVATAGLNKTIVVETPDAVLVASMDHDQLVKDVTVSLGIGMRLRHMTVNQPWGSYTRLGERDGFQVKHIVVKPGASLSLQKHHRRAEHWMIVRGRARVTNGEDVFEMHAPEHTYIPIETCIVWKIRVRNCSKLSRFNWGYLGEDDIVRFEDRYGRTESLLKAH